MTTKGRKSLNEFGVIFTTYALSLVTFFIFRLILFFTELDRIDGTTSTTNIFKAFFMGVRFDIIIIGYIMLLPALLLLIQYSIQKHFKNIVKFIFYWILVLFTLSFMISAADIPYFNHFFARFSIGAFEWMDNFDFVFNMIIQEPKYIAAVIPFLLLAFVYYRFLMAIFRKYKNTINNRKPSRFALAVRIIFSVLLLLLILIGIRGRLQRKSPMRIGTAYFCDNQFLNQLGLNPTFTLIKSYSDSKKYKNQLPTLMDNEQAVQQVRNYLNITNNYYSSPIARKITPDTISENKPNVIFIIMESMSAAKMGRHGNPDNLTPFLDSLSQQSYYFENYYTSGEHTFNGIFSTLFSHPAIFRFHPMKSGIQHYAGIAQTLKKLNYSTTYFTTHDGQFDNVEGFLHANSFDNVISQTDYPFNEIKTKLGVPDDYMFRFSMPILDKLAKKNHPFFVTFMTTSDHGPYYVPEYFTPKTNEIKKQIVEYADWSLQQFIEQSSEKEWFSNTIFVFTADHGAPIEVNYPIALNYHHSPLVIYAPKLLTPKTFEQISGQVDIFPTIMGLLKQEYINNTLGVDLINESRPYTIINGDDKVAALDNEYLFILKNNTEKSLYLYAEKNKTNVIDEYPEKAKEMETYLRSNLQTYQYLLNKNLTSIKEK